MALDKSIWDWASDQKRRILISPGRSGPPKESKMNAEITSARVESWIAKSARTGAIVHIGRDAKATVEELETLSLESEDSVDSTSTTGESEYWGTTGSGSKWRVHVEMDC